MIVQHGTHLKGRRSFNPVRSEIKSVGKIKIAIGNLCRSLYIPEFESRYI